MKKVIEKLQEKLNIGESAIVINPKNRFYFTRFPSSAGVLIVSRKQAFFLVDFRYFEKAKKEIKGITICLLKNTFAQIKEVLESVETKRVLLENESLTFSEFNRYKKELKGYEIEEENILSKEISDLRSIKNAEEVSFIKEAQRLTDETFEHILSFITPDMSEKEIALEMEFFMRKRGSEGVSFDFIVVSGKNSSLPHGKPTDKKIQNGDFITMDFGAVVNGYRSDMTRTIAVGSVTDKQREVYQTVLKAQTEALKAIKPDVKCCDIDKIARDIINNAGFENCFGHGLGHSLGLDVHESPACNTRDETLLKKGMLMTVEPGIYLENEFGVRIEDMVLVTDKGCENLTKSSKELIII